jgi:hypothetical protein
LEANHPPRVQTQGVAILTHEEIKEFVLRNAHVIETYGRMVAEYLKEDSERAIALVTPDAILGIKLLK